MSASTGAALAGSATAGQATFEPDEDEELGEDEPLETASPAFFSLLPEPSPDDPAEEEEEEESALEVVSDFLLSDPFAEAVAGSEPLRLSVR